MRKVILYIAASLDGYIAKPNDDLSFLSIVEETGQDYGYGEFIKTVDTVILGRKTYDWVMTQVPEFPHADKQTYVVTRTPKAGSEKLTYYSGDLKQLVTELKKKEGRDIFVDGGAEIANIFMRDGLIDEYIVSIIPILLGGGVRLFADGRPEQQLNLISSKQFNKGLVQLRYRA